mmetsp:Transcript_120906/g.240866  ORF Transcript_120906/g.240866 Transcript_120906/m.240866 type:complete len:232 (-) Transcript_120906:150-845(-)
MMRFAISVLFAMLALGLCERAEKNQVNIQEQFASVRSELTEIKEMLASIQTTQGVNRAENAGFVQKHEAEKTGGENCGPDTFCAFHFETEATTDGGTGISGRSIQALRKDSCTTITCPKVEIDFPVSSWNSQTQAETSRRKCCGYKRDAFESHTPQGGTWANDRFLGVKTGGRTRGSFAVPTVADVCANTEPQGTKQQYWNIIGRRKAAGQYLEYSSTEQRRADLLSSCDQ